MTQLASLNPLSPLVTDMRPVPPHALVESRSCYSVVFNMLGVEQKGIGIDVNLEKREVTVLARKERENLREGCFWVFGVPTDASLGQMTANFKAGVLEIAFPKNSIEMRA